MHEAFPEQERMNPDSVTESPSAHIRTLTRSVKIVSYERLQNICRHWPLIDFILFSRFNLTGSEDMYKVEKNAIEYVQNALVLLSYPIFFAHTFYFF